jgi:ABC-2 type transport system permease protein
LAIAWQLVCVSVLVKLGAGLFRKRVMQSGPQRAKRSWFRRGATVSA